MTDRTTDLPWGTVQHSESPADGIAFVDTASHGGFVLSLTRAAQMPADLVPFVRDPARRFWEEDVDAAAVALMFRDELGVGAGGVAQATNALSHFERTQPWPGIIEAARSERRN